VVNHDSKLYFLGAGASADAGVPLTGQLLRKVRAQISTGRGAKGHRRTLRQFIERFGLKHSLATDRPPLIDIISFLDSCLRDGRPLDTEFDLRTLTEVRRQLTVELSRAVRGPKNRGVRVAVPEGEAEDTVPPRIAAYQRKFVRSLTPRHAVEGKTRRGPGDSIITTNYDTNVDLGLYEVAYNDESEVTDIFLGSWFRNPDDDDEAFLEPKTSLEIFHLHGALNWLYCPRCSRAFVTAFTPSVEVLDAVGRADLSTKQRDDFTCFCAYSPMEPIIVAPSTFQEVRNPHLESIWAHAYLALERSGHWVFAGYSLPPEDLGIRSLLYRALDARERNRRPTAIEVVAKVETSSEKRSLELRYRQVLDRPKATVRFKWMSFQKYVDGLRPAGASKTARRPPGTIGARARGATG